MMMMLRLRERGFLVVQVISEGLLRLEDAADVGGGFASRDCRHK